MFTEGKLSRSLTKKPTSRAGNQLYLRRTGEAGKQKIKGTLDDIFYSFFLQLIDYIYIYFL